MVGAEQVLPSLNAGDKDLLREFHYRLFECLGSADEPMMQNFVLFQVKRMEYPGILAQKFIFHPRPWGNLWHWNKSALFLVTVIRQNNVNMIKKKASIILFTLSKDMPIVLGIVYFSICFWLRLQKAAARIHTVIGVVVIKVYCDYKHRVHKIFSC